MAPFIPLDIVDLVLDKLDLSYESGLTALRSCAIVCASWTPSAQKLLFHRLELSTALHRDERKVAQNVSRLLHLLQLRPHLAGYIRELKLASRTLPRPKNQARAATPYLVCNSNLWDLLLLLRNVRKLGFAIDNTWRQLPSALTRALGIMISQSQCEDISLMLRSISPNATELSGFLGCCATSLKRLKLDELTPEDNTNHPTQVVSVPLDEAIVDLKRLDILSFTSPGQYHFEHAIFPSNLRVYVQHLSLSAPFCPTFPPAGLPTTVSKLGLYLFVDRECLEYMEDSALLIDMIQVGSLLESPPRIPISNNYHNVRHLALDIHVSVDTMPDIQDQTMLPVLSAFFTDLPLDFLQSLEHVTIKVSVRPGRIIPPDIHQRKQWAAIDAKLGPVCTLKAVELCLRLPMGYEISVGGMSYLSAMYARLLPGLAGKSILQVHRASSWDLMVSLMST